MDTQLPFAAPLGFLTPDVHTALQSKVDECGKVNAGLIRSIEQPRA